MRGGKLNDTRFGMRMQGEGPYIDAVRLLFDQTERRLGLKAREMGGQNAINDERPVKTETTFRRPTKLTEPTEKGGQLRLF
jgi:hypothetical protein